MPGEEPTGEQQVTTFKQYADFAFLNQVIRLSAFALSGDEYEIPELPAKRTENGNKKSADELQGELDEYINDLLQIPIVARMLQTKLFFGVNQFTDLEDEEEKRASDKLEIGEMLYPEESLVPKVELKKSNFHEFDNNQNDGYR